MNTIWYHNLLNKWEKTKRKNVSTKHEFYLIEFILFCVLSKFQYRRLFTSRVQDGKINQKLYPNVLIEGWWSTVGYSMPTTHSPYSILSWCGKRNDVLSNLCTFMHAFVLFAAGAVSPGWRGLALIHTIGHTPSQSCCLLHGCVRMLISVYAFAGCLWHKRAEVAVSVDGGGVCRSPRNYRCLALTAEVAYAPAM